MAKCLAFTFIKSIKSTGSEHSGIIHSKMNIGDVSMALCHSLYMGRKIQCTKQLGDSLEQNIGC